MVFANTPLSLGKHQAYLKEQLKAKDDKPTFFVFHGGSGSAASEFQEAISHGVVKVNLDTDLQWAYLCGVRDTRDQEHPVPQLAGRQPRGRGQAQQEEV